MESLTCKDENLRKAPLLAQIERHTSHLRIKEQRVIRSVKNRGEVLWFQKDVCNTDGSKMKKEHNGGEFMQNKARLNPQNNYQERDKLNRGNKLNCSTDEAEGLIKNVGERLKKNVDK